MRTPTLAAQIADQMAEILPAVREVLSSQVDTSNNRGKYLCATFEIPDHPESWVQFSGQVLNLAYPTTEDPSVHLKAALSHLQSWQVEGWEPGKFATVSMGALTAPAVARAIDAVFREFGAVGTYPLDTSLQWLDSEA